MSNGKGSRPRPPSVPADTYAANYERTFGGTQAEFAIALEESLERRKRHAVEVARAIALDAPAKPPHTTEASAPHPPLGSEK